MTSTDTTTTGALPRRPGDPTPDLLDYRLIHRAMTVDLDRLANAAAELADRPDPARTAALRHYLAAVSHEIESHHHVEDEHVWPLLEAVAGDRTALVPLTEDHDRLDPLLHRAAELAGADRPGPELAAVLREVADMLARHIADEERDVFPLIEECVRVEDYRRLQRRFRDNLRPSMLPFLVPWGVRHATSAELPAVLRSAGWPLRILLRLFEPRFRAREELLFGPAGLSREDRKRVRMMRRVTAVHQTVIRLTGGRAGHRWIGGSVAVLLTVTGRRTGRPHTVGLMSLRDGEDFLVLASQGGVDREPHWWLNLQADPRAELQFRGARFAVTATQVTGGEREATWARFVAAYGAIADYQTKVRRQIAVVRLRREPV